MNPNISKVKDIENKLISILNSIFNNHEKSNLHSYNYLCDKADDKYGAKLFIPVIQVYAKKRKEMSVLFTQNILFIRFKVMINFLIKKQRKRLNIF